MPVAAQDQPATTPATPSTKYNLADLKLEGNVGAIVPPEPCLAAWLPALPVTVSVEEIRHEFETKGVLHVKGAMPREFVLAASNK